MNPNTISPEGLQIIIDQTTARYMVALLILFGMLSIALGTLCLALGFRKCGLFFIGVYGLLMSFIGVGLCYIFGPVIILFATGGLIREWMNAPKKA